MIKIEHTPTGQIMINGRILAQDPLDPSVGGEKDIKKILSGSLPNSSPGKKASPKIELMIFDMDGTLIDTRKSIVKAVNHTLRKMDREELLFDKIISYIGGSLEGLMEKVLETEDTEKIKRGANIFTRYYEENFTETSELYPHVKEVLDYFKNKRMVLITNASRAMSSAALGHFKINEYFEEIFTGDNQDCVKPSACPIDKARDYLDAYPRSSLIAGDMAVDIKAGKKAGIKTCGVTYGIGSEKELKKESPDFVIDDIEELEAIIK